MDVLSPKQRSYNMSRIQGKNTKPEKLLRKWLWANGYRYRLYKKDLPGKPDIVFVSRKKAIFVNGCFWHKHNCEFFRWPKTNIEFWKTKISKNVERDANNYAALTKRGWSYLIVWECSFKNLKKEGLENRINVIGRLIRKFVDSEEFDGTEIDLHRLPFPD